MKVLRKQEIETANIQVGDQVIIPLAEIGEFSATAHKVTDEGIMFIFDEYITRRPMNSKNTNKGGFEKSELKKWMDTVLLMAFPEELRDNSQFFTPYHVCELMAKVTEEDVAAVVKEKGYITINDFCCGAGATLIAAINEARKQLEKVNLNFQNHVLVVAQDIDEIVALMCYIQLSLLGVAAYIKVGDVFTQPMSTDDNGENYWFTMMYFSDVWTMRRVFHSL